MQLGQLITPQCVYIDQHSKSKTAVFHTLCQLFTNALPELDVDVLFEAYWERENLGSTAIGHGIIIPHVRTAAITSPKACFIKLLHPVDFGAKDKQPADLVIGLIVPNNQETQHLTLLSTIIKQFSESGFRKACRKSNNTESLYTLLVSGLLAVQV